MSKFLGMTPEQVEAAGRALNTESTNLSAAVGRIQRLIDDSQRSWNGPDARAFAMMWQGSLRSQVKGASDLLGQMSSSLARNAQAQRTASGDKPSIVAKRLGPGSFPVGGVIPVKVGLTGYHSGIDWGQYDDKGIDVTTIPVDQFVRDDMKEIEEAVGIPQDKETGTADNVESKVELLTLGAGAVTAGLAGAASGSFGDDSGIHGSVEASYWAGAHAEGSDGVTLKDGQVELGASGTAGVGVHGEASGQIGYGGLQAEGKAEATAGAWVAADTSVSIGKDGVKASGDVQAMAGASASAHGSVGVEGAQLGVGVTAYAGAGVQAHVEASVTAKEIKVSFDVGAALGVGIGVKFDIDIKPAAVVNFFKKHWPFW